MEQAKKRCYTSSQAGMRANFFLETSLYTVYTAFAPYALTIAFCGMPYNQVSEASCDSSVPDCF
jgi:hypothetical protein